ncbi:hypothetical protein A245_22269, partial [Pseudomonas syringae pv. actinidiae ICMP 19096]
MPTAVIFKQRVHLIGEGCALLHCLQIITQAIVCRAPDQFGKARIELIQLLLKRFAVGDATA